MSIVHLSTATGWRGGEQQALWLAEGLQKRSIPTRVIAQPESPLAERARAAGLAVDEVRCGGEFDLGAWWRVSRVLRREKAMVVWGLVE